MEIAHSRNKPMENCAVLSPMHKECGHKTPKFRKKPRKSEHEIHKAIRWKEEIQELGIGQNAFARRKALSNGAVSHVLKWLELSDGAQALIRDVDDPMQIQAISRNFRKYILQLRPDEQAKAIKTRVKSV